MPNESERAQLTEHIAVVCTRSEHKHGIQEEGKHLEGSRRIS